MENEEDIPGSMCSKIREYKPTQKP
jgi:hypothetical protein